MATNEPADGSQADAPLVSGVFVTPTLRLVRPLSAGGMGRVWVAEHLGLRTNVVVKFMLEELASNADARARFEREASAASQVKSPHVVHMIDYGITPTGLPYIAMELLEGMDLRHLMTQRGTLTLGEVVSVVGQVCRALMAAHQKGIVHRDIKPENIFLTDAGDGQMFVKVLDFGIAKAVFGSSFSSTSTGAMIGSPFYMSPEQVLGQKNLDHRADLWAVAVVAFEALTGTVPFSGDTVGAISVAICKGTPPVPSSRAPQLGPVVDAWFARACAHDPADRFPSGRELAEALATAAGMQSDPGFRAGSQIIGPPGAGSFGSTTPGRAMTPGGGSVSASGRFQIMTPADTAAANTVADPRVGSGAHRLTTNAPTAGDSAVAGRTSATKWALGNPVSATVATLTILGVGMAGGFGVYMATRGREAAAVAAVATPTAAPAPVSSETPAPDQPAVIPAANAVQLSLRASPPAARLYLDDAPLEGNPFDGKFPRDGLAHRVRAEAPGFIPKVELVTFDRDVSFQLALEPDAGAPAAKTAAPVRTPAPVPATGPGPKDKPRPKLDTIN